MSVGKIKNIAEVAHKELQSSKNGDRFSHSAVISELLGFKDIFVHHEILPPGRRASSPHSHSEQEEMVFVLSGTPTAHVGHKIVELVPGDFIGFNPGTNELHFLENKTETAACILVIASGPKNDKVTYGGNS